MQIKISQKPTINEALKKEFVADDSKNTYDYSKIPFWYDDDDDDDYYDYYGYAEGLLYKPMSNTDDSTTDSQLDEPKSIFYVDKITPNFTTEKFEKTVQRFPCVRDFKDFCDSNGINISANELNLLKYRPISYCCVDPIEKEKSKDLFIISNSSWVGLYYDSVESNDDFLL